VRSTAFAAEEGAASAPAAIEPVQAGDLEAAAAAAGKKAWVSDDLRKSERAELGSAKVRVLAPSRAWGGGAAHGRCRPTSQQAA